MLGGMLVGTDHMGAQEVAPSVYRGPRGRVGLGMDALAFVLMDDLQHGCCGRGLPVNGAVVFHVDRSACQRGLPMCRWPRVQLVPVFEVTRSAYCGVGLPDCGALLSACVWRLGRVLAFAPGYLTG